MKPSEILIGIILVYIHIWSNVCITTSYEQPFSKFSDPSCRYISRIHSLWANINNNHNNTNGRTAPSFFPKWWKYVKLTIYLISYLRLDSGLNWRLCSHVLLKIEQQTIYALNGDEIRAVIFCIGHYIITINKYCFNTNIKIATYYQKQLP